MVATFGNEMRLAIEEYLQSLTGKSEGTRNAYGNVLQQLRRWMTDLPGKPKQWADLTPELVGAYFEALQAQNYSLSYRRQAKTVIGSFGNWLGNEKGLLSRNPVQGIKIEDEDRSDNDSEESPRKLEVEQRWILKQLVERAGELRGTAIFALAYWAGCRVNDISWLRLEDCVVGPKVGAIQVGYQADKMREIDLVNEARRPLYAYVRSIRLDSTTPYLFRSQRSARLTEAGIHHWFRHLKTLASPQEWPLVGPVNFHDLRHDFAQRARQAGWSLEEIAYYLGNHLPNRSSLAQYAVVDRRDLKQKLAFLKG